MTGSIIQGRDSFQQFVDKFNDLSDKTLGQFNIEKTTWSNFVLDVTGGRYNDNGDIVEVDDAQFELDSASTYHIVLNLGTQALAAYKQGSVPGSTLHLWTVVTGVTSISYATDLRTTNFITGSEIFYSYVEDAKRYKEETEGLKNYVQDAVFEVDNNSRIIGSETVSFNYVGVSKVIRKKVGNWRTKCSHLSWHTTDKPAVYLGQYASVADAVADGGEIGTYFYNTADTFWYEITAVDTPAATRIHAAGQADFPAEAVIAITGVENSTRVIIHDVSVEGCPMWREFTSFSSGIFNSHPSASGTVNLSDIKMIGSKLIVSANGAANASGPGVYILDFAYGTALFYNSVGMYATKEGIATSVTYSAIKTGSGHTLPNRYVNAIATYTAPNAPIDPVSGEAVTYIAVATDGGGAVITPDGKVRATSYTATVYDAVVHKGRAYFVLEPASVRSVYDYGPVVDFVDNASSVSVFSTATTPALSGNALALYEANEQIAIRCTGGIVNFLRPNPSSASDSTIQKITANSNTGPYIDSVGTAAIMCGTEEGSVSGGNIYPIENALKGTGNTTTDVAVALATRSVEESITNGNAYAIKVVITEAGGRLQPTLHTLLASLGIGVGDAFKLSYSARVDSNAPWRSRVGSNPTATSGTIYDQMIPDDGTYADYSGVMVRPSGDLYYALRRESGSGGDVAYITAFSIEKLATDHSGNANHFDINGTLTRTQTATDGIAAWSGFSATNYLERAYDSDWDVGAGDFFARGVLDGTGTLSVSNALWCRGDAAASGNRILIAATSTGAVRVDITGSTKLTSPGTYHDGVIHTWCVARINGILYLIIDGGVVESAASTEDLDNASAIIRVGLIYNGTGFYPGAIGAIQQHPGSTSLSEIRDWHNQMMTMIQNGNVTLDAAPVAASFDQKNGLTKLADASNVYDFKSGSILATDASTVGTIADVSVDEEGGLVVSGSSGIEVYNPARNLRESTLRKAVKTFTILYSGNASRVQFPLQTSVTEIAATEGCKPKKVWVAGQLMTEGSADDYTIKFDGYNYWVEMAVAPGNDTNNVQVEFEKEIWE